MHLQYNFITSSLYNSLSFYRYLVTTEYLRLAAKQKTPIETIVGGVQVSTTICRECFTVSPTIFMKLCRARHTVLKLCNLFVGYSK